MNRDLNKVCLIEHKVYNDSRGCFSEVFRESEIFGDLSKRFVQMNFSRSKKGVFRGLHYQRFPYQTSKLVKCLNGKIFDVSLDLRKDSETYGKCFCYTLDQNQNSVLYVPETFAHGILALEDNTIIAYMVSEYHRESMGVAISYKDFGINFPIEVTNVSEKDRNSLSFEQYREKYENE